MPDLADLLVLAGLVLLVHVLAAISQLGAEAFVGLLLVAAGVVRGGLIPRRMDGGK